MAIRKSPSDFLVEEVLADAVAAGAREGAASASEPGPARANGAAAFKPERAPGWGHAVFRLSKTSLTTPEAIERLGKALRFKPAKVDYAGLKDKHAVTVQFVSAPGIDPRRIPSGQRGLGGPGWAATFVGWSSRPMTAEMIRGNRFRIVVRDLAREASDEMERRAGLLEAPSDGTGGRRLWVINYFGAQRFGSARHGKGFVAEALVKGEFEAGLRLAIGTPARKDSGRTRDFTRILASRWGDWEGLAATLPKCPERGAIEVLAERTRRSGAPGPADFRDAFSALPFFLQAMYLEALQSKLWNATARRLVNDVNAGSKVARSLVSEDQYGTMAFAPAASLGKEWLALQVPLLAPKTKPAPPWWPAAEAALAESSLTLSSLQIPGLARPYFGEALRPMVAEASEFVLSAAEADEGLPGSKRVKRTVSFQLPRGAYATVVLRALGQ
ncbi:MAG: tRNA pseudouridine(13) synthase TruD [Phycisphaerales bacterium]